MVVALITISTRASLKRYHTYTLTLGIGENGDEWEFQRIGTASEKSSVEKELHELRERLSKVEEWRKRRQEIDDELNKVWLDGGEELAPPPYAEAEATGESEEDDDDDEAQAEDSFVQAEEGNSGEIDSSVEVV